MKLKSMIVMVKRIKRFIPCPEYLKIYDPLFLSHLTYIIVYYYHQVVMQNIYFLNFCYSENMYQIFIWELESSLHLTTQSVIELCYHMCENNFTLAHSKPRFNKHGLLSSKSTCLHYHIFI